jgi:hypothetical protein
MDALAPPKAKRRLCGTALRKLQLLAVYYATAFLARILAAPFWFFEKRRGQLADWLDNERSKP